MKKLNQKQRIIIYTVYSLILFIAFFCLNNVPNHRVGWYIDYDLWLISSIFPPILVFHGIISKLITKNLKLYFPLTVTGILGFIESLINADNFKYAFWGMIYYLALTLVGIAVFYAFLWVIKLIKVIWKYRHGYSK